MDCEVCFRDYEREAIVPRVIECGHTFCTNCITDQFKTSSNCPKCKEPFTKETSEDYPINCALLRSVDAHNATEGLLKQMFDAKLKLATIEKECKETKMEVDSNLSKISNAEKSVEDLLNLKSLDVERSNETLLEINKIMKEVSIGKIMKEVSMSKIMDDQKLKNSVGLSRDDYQTNKEFLQDIHYQLDNKEQLYAVTLIDGKVNYAHLTRLNNKIYLHAFDLLVPAEPNKTIWFSDLKRCFNDSLRAFLKINNGWCCGDISYQTAIMKTVNDSNLVHVFLKYCTGETGPVYKGMKLSLFSYNKFKSLKIKPILHSKYGHEYDFTSDYKRAAQPDILKDWSGKICQLSQDGSLEIVDSKRDTVHRGLVAIIEEPGIYLPRPYVSI